MSCGQESALRIEVSLSGRCRVGSDMNMIYNSDHYCVVEFSDFGVDGKHAEGGYEIVDKNMRREIFLGGHNAEQFRATVQAMIQGDDEPSPEDFDEFLGGYVGLMNQPVILH